MKTLLLSVCALICAVSSVFSQEIRLDSLWAKFGGVGAMSFSPDSKTLLIAEPQKLAGGSGTIRFYDAATGQETGNIPSTDYLDVRYTPDGKRIITTERQSIKIYDAFTLHIEREIPFDKGGAIEFSSDVAIVALYGNSQINVVNIESGMVLVNITRPGSYTVSPGQTREYFNGKVCFSADGKYIMGKYANSLVQWDWRTTPDKPETLVPNLPNRAVIGFSPDKSLFVQQSNYLWDIEQKKQIPLQLEEGNQNDLDAPFTSGSRYLICTGDRLLHIIDVENQHVLYKGNRRRSGLICLSPDSNIVAYTRGGFNTAPIIEKIVWLPTGVIDIPDSPVAISFFPLPGSDHATVKINNMIIGKQYRVFIIDQSGKTVTEVFSGLSESANLSFPITIQFLTPGKYSVVMKLEGRDYSQQFIIIR